MKNKHTNFYNEIEGVTSGDFALYIFLLFVLAGSLIATMKLISDVAEFIITYNALI